MCIQDIKIGRAKYSRTFEQNYTTDKLLHPGSQTAIVTPQVAFSTPRLFIGPNANRTSLRLVLAAPGDFNNITSKFIPLDYSVYGFIWQGPADQTLTINFPIYAAMSVKTTANMSDQIDIEKFGVAITGAWCFQPWWSNNGAALLGGFTVWDIQGDDTLMHAVQQPPQV